MGKGVSGRDKGGAVEALALAWSFGWPTAAGVLVGYWLDGWLGTAPWLTLLLAISAMVLAVVRIIASLDRERMGQ